MESIKVGDVVEMYNDDMTAVSGRVVEVRAYTQKVYWPESKVAEIVSVRLAGLADDLRDYQWVVTSINGKAV